MGVYALYEVANCNQFLPKIIQFLTYLVKRRRSSSYLAYCRDSSHAIPKQTIHNHKSEGIISIMIDGS